MVSNYQLGIYVSYLDIVIIIYTDLHRIAVFKLGT